MNDHVAETVGELASSAQEKRSTMQFISIEDLAQTLRVTIWAIHKTIKRHGLDVHRLRKDGGGFKLMISIESLKEAGLLTHGFIERSEGNKLLASSIVRKGFDRLTDTELNLLERVDPLWKQSSQSKIIQAFSSLLGVSRAWLYRDHTTDGRSDRGSAWGLMGAKQRERVLKLFIQYRNRRSFVTECIREDDLPRLSDRTWYRIGAMLAKDYHDELTLIRKGPIALRQETEPVLRDKTYLKPLQVIVGDYWRVDRVVKWVDGDLVRPSLSVWVDQRTNMIVGVALAKNPNALGVKTSLLYVFLRFGIPEIAYMDNGKEYKAHRVAGTSVEVINIHADWMSDIDSDLKKFEVKGFLPSMRIRDLRAIVKNPRAKIVERIFGRGGFSDWAKEFSDWIGGKYWERPEQVQKAIVDFRVQRREHSAKLYHDAITGEAIPFTTIEGLSAEIYGFIQFHNNRQSKGFGMDGKSPAELFAELSKEHTPRKASTYQIAFSFLEGKDKPKKIRKNGLIEFKRDFFYRADRLWNHRLEQVYALYNPVDGFWWTRADGKQSEFLPNSLLVYDMNGVFIDEATFKERVHPTEADVKPLMQVTQRTVKEARDTLRGLIAGSGLPELPTVDVKTIPEEVIKEEERRKEENRKTKTNVVRKSIKEILDENGGDL